jgi:MerR family transcriptional regulator/heat shock protein HspR
LSSVLSVAPARSAVGVRLYSEEDLQILGRIATLVSAGVSLEGVRRILQLEADLAAKRKEIDELRAAAASGAQSQARHRVVR